MTDDSILQRSPSQYWTPSQQLQTRSAADALLQSIDLAVAAEALGADGAYFRVHQKNS